MRGLQYPQRGTHPKASAHAIKDKARKTESALSDQHQHHAPKVCYLANVPAASKPARSNGYQLTGGACPDRTRTAKLFSRWHGADRAWAQIAPLAGVKF
jgi:hypothetical protein